MIEFRNVSKTYPNGTKALERVNLRINTGEFVFIVGQSGAGKTTLLKLLLCEEEPTSGRIIVNGHDLRRFDEKTIPYYRRQLGVVFQDFRLFKTKTVYENVSFAMYAVGTPKKIIRRRVPQILQMVNLLDKANSFPDQLSGGEQQRVAIARALANDPKIIIADEPTGNIDPKMSVEIIKMLMQIRQHNKTVIVITHDKELVDMFRQRVITLSKGSIVSDKVGEMYSV